MVPYGCAEADVLACVVSSKRVPLSSRTLFPEEAITEPCAEFEVSAVRLNPFKPNTPRLFAASWPDELSPPVAPCVVTPVAVFAVEFTVEFAAPEISPVVRAVVLAAPLTAPPTGAVPPVRFAPPIELGAPELPMPCRSSPPIAATPGGAAMACNVSCTATS